MPSNADIRLLGELKKRRAEVLLSLKDVPDPRLVGLVIAQIDEQIAELEAREMQKQVKTWKARFPSAS
jgi:hypothetical protein